MRKKKRACGNTDMMGDNPCILAKGHTPPHESEKDRKMGVQKCGIPCRTSNCKYAVVEIGGDWYITMGHSGFNSPANNRFGYLTQQKAVAAYRRYGGNR